jgi:hypothetical protein
MVIIAGYEKELNRHFFSANPGLESRFIWRFYIDSYTASELCSIFLKKIADSGWVIEETVSDWFVKHKDSFKHFGRDMELLFFYVKICHSKRVFGKPETEKRRISLKDIEAGFAMFLANRKKEDSSNKLKREILTSMYI